MLEALSFVPGFSNIISLYGGSINFARGYVTRNQYQSDLTNKIHGPANVSLMLHPTHPILLEKVLNQFRFKSPMTDGINFQDFGHGGEIKIYIDELPFEAAYLPDTVNIDDNNLLYWNGDHVMNGFGYMYVALYILGNFARYYPDIWMKAVEQSHPVAIVAERFIELAEERLPLAALSEISRVCHVPAS